jgi:hypothetical protein
VVLTTTSAFCRKLQKRNGFNCRKIYKLNYFLERMFSKKERLFISFLLISLVSFGFVFAASINLDMISPMEDIDVTQNELFDVTSEVCCNPKFQVCGTPRCDTYLSTGTCATKP